MRLAVGCARRRAVLALRTLTGHCLAESGHLSVRFTRGVLRLESAETAECLEHMIACLECLGVRVVVQDTYGFQFFPEWLCWDLYRKKLTLMGRGLREVAKIQDALPNDSSRCF